jgi:hypothetical protein
LCLDWSLLEFTYNVACEDCKFELLLVGYNFVFFVVRVYVFEGDIRVVVCERVEPKQCFEVLHPREVLAEFVPAQCISSSWPSAILPKIQVHHY